MNRALPPMHPRDVRIRRADPDDAAAIGAAHLDSIRSIGPGFYAPDLVDAWSADLSPDIYVRAMNGGEVFFVATDDAGGDSIVLGFSSHRRDAARDGVSVYVRGRAARRGIGTALLREAEAHALARGATNLYIEAALAGVEFYAANGFVETGPGEVALRSGRSLPCVFMSKLFTR